ncbi:hypothetical protein TIFTF001_011373 [Ficus carica]|uniref:Uncharacterized protein n=1 Tax=Ficus carica TaxID=3494 RepID=A0AA88D2T1_FICCA|nr:hypothetical protein TIFTF001_011373 [Ficus carica]
MASSTTHAASSILRRVHQGTHAAFPLSLATLRPYRRSTSRKVVMYIAWRNSHYILTPVDRPQLYLVAAALFAAKRHDHRLPPLTWNYQPALHGLRQPLCQSGLRILLYKSHACYQCGLIESIHLQ